MLSYKFYKTFKTVLLQIRFGRLPLQLFGKYFWKKKISKVGQDLRKLISAACAQFLSACAKIKT